METFTTEKAAAIAMRQKEDCENHKQVRLSKILEMQQAYYGKFRPTPRGRSGIPLPFFSKYVDEIKARIDDSPVIKVKHKKDSQILLAHKIQSAIENDRSPSAGDWNRMDRQAKFMAIFSGVLAYDYFAESDPEYNSVLEALDIFDLYFEATGGNDFENHAFVGKGNMFRSRSEIEALAESGVYDMKMVKEMLSGSAGATYKEQEARYLSRYDRFKASGVDMTNNNYIGEEFYPLAQWQMKHGGKRYMLTFNQVSGKPVRFKPLKEVYGSNLYSIVMAQTHEDPYVVLGKSPADDIWPIAEWLRIQGNYLIDHSTKQVWGQTVYDPNFIEGSELEWNRPGQLSIGRSYQGQPLQRGIYQITTPDKTIVTIDMLKYFEAFMASVAGVAPQDATEEQMKVAVMFGNLQKSSARMGVYNKSYSEVWNKITTRYIWGLKENLTEKMAVKIMGEHGAEWDELSKQELDAKTDFDIEVVGADVELQMNEARKMKQEKALTQIVTDPDIKKEFNLRVLGEEIARSAGFSEETIKRAMDVQSYGSERIVSHASMAIEKILKGKTPELYRGADISFLKYIQDFVTETNLKDQEAIDILNYARSHIQIVVKNMAIKASLIQAQKGISPTDTQPTNGQGIPNAAAPGAPTPSSPPQRVGAGAPSGVVPSMGVVPQQQ